MFDFVKSTVGRKYIMGISGLVWMGFVLSHMAGNMLILVSPDLYNAYGHAIVSNKPLLYGAESVLVLALIVHVMTAISLTVENRKAKGSRYAVSASGDKASTLASRTMGMQGSVVLAFIILHLATFKYGTHYDTVVNGVQMRDLHRLIVEVFQQPGYVLWYVVALVLLMFHLSHGASSIFQSFGFLERKMQKGLRKFAWTYAIIVVAGFLSQPAYVFLLKGK
ncbi:succinate dehydrogenase cytochrome b subunit [Pseudobdellovibrio sp. HCB154]|uniref:succinate dehydrogenase cytochrome b subunit n=1 Tax=Pseudobdellovibrio sp. HCB154 TaxID=3386277 RepID=UPI003916F757